jgi:hypothetical protein
MLRPALRPNRVRLLPAFHLESPAVRGPNRRAFSAGNKIACARPYLSGWGRVLECQIGWEGAMSYCVYTLSDSTGVRFVGAGVTGKELEPLDKIRRAGLVCGVNRWLDELAAKGETVTLARAISGVDAREADRAAKKLADQLPGLINLPRGKPFETRRCVAIFANGRTRWYRSIVGMCEAFGVSRFNGIDVTGRVLSQRRKPRARTACSHNLLAEPAPATCSNGANHAANGRVEDRAANGRVEDHAANGRAMPPAAGKKLSRARKNSRRARFAGTLCCKDNQFGGLSARVLPDRPDDAAN